MNFISPSEPVSQRRSSKHRYARILAVVCFVTLVMLSGGAWSLAQTRKKTMLAGIEVLQIPLGGLSPSEAKIRLETVVEMFLRDDLMVHSSQGHSFSLGARKDFLYYDLTAALEEAFQVGRRGSWPARLLAPFEANFLGYTATTSIKIDEERLERYLRTHLKDVLKNPEDAKLTIQTNDRSSTVEITPEVSGWTFDPKITTSRLQRMLDEQSLSLAPLNVELEHRSPMLHAQDLEPLLSLAQAWLEYPPFTLVAEDTQIKISRSDMAEWIMVTTSTEPASLNLDSRSIRQTLEAKASELTKPAKDGTIRLNETGQVIAFIAPQEGVDFDIPSIQTSIVSGQRAGSSTIPLVLTRIQPTITGDGEHLGIREVIGVGRSNFSGSPINRRKNIALGGKHVHMTLIPSGEEFSMLKTLGMIDGEHGWLPELVIKENKTTPEFGGGLCQVGTTMFRAALASGLPITERRNHSYRVRYYEPAGTDATIYDPSPDFRFKNDTAHALLITSRLEGDTLEFTVWGTHDGRKTEQTKPRIYNVVAAPPKKIIETLSLKPGEEKCTEKEHAGADAQFDYAVSYVDGRVEKNTFFSRYRPWQAVCLRGVSALSSTTTQEIVSQPLIP